MPQKILVVEDDPDIAEMVAYNLGKEGYGVALSRDGSDALSRAIEDLPDLVVLDLMLPGLDGLEVCRRLRQEERTKAMPIIMLTARSQEVDKVVGLELGADDYMTKPFSPRELLARVRAVLRRAGRHMDSAVRSGEVEVDSVRHRVRVSGAEVALTSTEFRLLEFMAQRPGEVLTRARILGEVFGYAADVYDRTVDTHIKALRRKLGQARDHIETVRGSGYRFREG